MSTSVLKCPLCGKPFQVLRTEVEQVVKCPSCLKKVSVPPLAAQTRAMSPQPTGNPNADHGDSDDSVRVNEFSGAVKSGKSKTTGREKPKRPPIVFACPNCRSKFGVTKTMLGRSVACPHCKSTVKISAPKLADKTRGPGVPDQTASSPPKGEKKTTRSKRQAESPDKKNADVPGGNLDLAITGTEFKPIGAKKKEPTMQKPAGKRVAKKKTKASGETGQTSRPKRADSKPPQNAVSKLEESSRKKWAGKETTVESGTVGEAAHKKARADVGQTPLAESKHDESRDEKSKPSTDAATGSASVAGVEPKATATPEAIDFVETDPTAETESSNELQSSNEIQSEPAAQSLPEANRDTDVEFVPRDIGHLLPPKFNVDDPERLAFSTGRDKERTVFLPDGEGGLSKFDERLVTVEHNGQSVELVNLTPAQRRTRRLIQNVVVATLLMALLLVVFWFLRKTA